jgi:hypothetical protein
MKIGFLTDPEAQSNIFQLLKQKNQTKEKTRND